jgi:hypothetical protein
MCRQAGKRRMERKGYSSLVRQESAQLLRSAHQEELGPYGRQRKQTGHRRESRKPRTASTPQCGRSEPPQRATFAIFAASRRCRAAWRVGPQARNRIHGLETPRDPRHALPEAPPHLAPAALSDTTPRSVDRSALRSSGGGRSLPKKLEFEGRAKISHLDLGR